jgi:hypothetical protein
MRFLTETRGTIHELLAQDIEECVSDGPAACKV